MKNILNKKNITKIAMLSLLILGFNACGGSDASFKKNETMIAITIPCQTTPTQADISGYITVNSGDVIVKDTTTAEISIYHDVNNNKKVCLVSGQAHIIKK